MIKIIFRKIYNFFKSKFMNLRYKDVHFGKKTMFTANCAMEFAKGSKVDIGDRIFTDGFCRFTAGKDAHLQLGYNCYFNMNCFIGANEKVVIGEHCIFGPNVTVIDNDHKFAKNKGISPGGHNSGEIIVGKECWFGANVVILRNTHIGDGCVIGAGCVVKGDIPANTIITNKQDLHMHQIGDR